MDFETLIHSRRSIRRYTPEALTSEEIDAILRAALLAPSSKHCMPWEFVFVDEREKLKALAACRSAGSLFLKDAAAAIVVCGRSDVTDVWIEDCSIACAHMLLAAENCGLGACWVQMRNRGMDGGTTASDLLHVLFGLPGKVEPLAVIAVGHKAEAKPAHIDEELRWEKVHHNVF